jgi:hypothetical protein
MSDQFLLNANLIVFAIINAFIYFEVIIPKHLSESNANQVWSGKSGLMARIVSVNFLSYCN